MAPTLVADPDLVTPEWLTDVLRMRARSARPRGRLVRCVVDRHGAGRRQRALRADVRRRARVRRRLSCKFSSRDPRRARQRACATLTYETEVAFYRELAHTVDISRPHCYFAELESRHRQRRAGHGGPRAGGAGRPDRRLRRSTQATLAIDEAAKLHGPRWGDPTLAELAWLDRSSQSEGMAAMLSRHLGGLRRALPVHARSGHARGRRGSSLRSRPAADVAQAAPYAPPSTSDYRLDNMLFGAGERTGR